LEGREGVMRKRENLGLGGRGKLCYDNGNRHRKKKRGGGRKTCILGR